MKPFRHIRSIKAVQISLAILLVAALFTGPSVTNAADNTPKEEVVYALLRPDGGPETAYIVNVFDMDRPGSITDYGDYDYVTNLTTAEEIRQSGSSNTVDAPAGRFYYQGDMPGAALPWIFSIEYTLDGAPVSSEALAGSTGALNIDITIRQNSGVPEDSFYRYFALQTTVTLDTAACRNIVSDGATAANVGGDKALTYTALPGKGADISISADVENFEMAGIQFSGVPFSLDMEEPDTQELTGDIVELQDGITQLDDGAARLNDGVSDLSGGTGALRDAAGQFNSGVSELSEGMMLLQSGTRDLYSGAGDIKNGFSALVGQSAALTKGSSQVREGLGMLKTAVSDFAEQSASTDDLQALKQGANDMQAGLSALDSQFPALTEGADALGQGISGAKEALDAIVNAGKSSDLQSAIAYVESTYGAVDPAVAAVVAALKSQTTAVSVVADGVSRLSGQYAVFQGGITQAAQAVSALTGSHAQLNGGIQLMADGLLTMLAQDGPLSQLKDGITELDTQYAALDDGVGQYTQGVSDLSGGYSALYSGISALNGSAGQLRQGAGQLQKGAGALADGAQELDSGVDSLSEGTGELLEGTNELRTRTADMDTQVQDRIDELLETYLPGDFPLKSFASPENTQVNSVQFVIRTPDILIDGPTTPEEEIPPETTFWDKFLQLFGL